MATSLTLLTPNTNNPKPESMEDYHGAAVAKPGGAAAGAMVFAKSNNNSKEGRKPNGKGPNPKNRKPQRGMGVEKLERLRKESESKSTMNQFPCHDPAAAANVVPVLHGVAAAAANYGVPPVPVPSMVINGWGCGGGFNGQVLLGNHNNHGAGNVLQVGSGFVEASSKELSSIPKFHQYCKPDPCCDVCFKKKRYDGENGKFNGGLSNQFGQIFPNKGADLHGYWNQENNQKPNETMNGFTARAARSAYAYTTGGQMNTNETVDVVAVHRKGNSFGSYVTEYEFFPGKNGKNTASKEWEFLPIQEPSSSSSTGFAVMNGGEASSSSPSKCVDLSLKLSY